MKTLLLTVLLTGSALCSYAQQPILTPTATKRTEEYCQLKARQKLNGKVVISIDYGQQQKLISENLFRDATGRAIEFNSAIDALNWLNSQGWEFVNAYVLVDKDDSDSYYIMRRRVAS